MAAVIPASAPGPVLDSHHHLWRVARGDYGWMTPDMAIARDYLADDLAPLLRQAGVARTILVQAAPTEAETDFLLDIAARTGFVAGVCGWLDMDSDTFPDRLAHYRQNPLWKSFRPMLESLDAPDWILRPRVLRNLAHAAESGARFEILVRPAQLPHVIEAVQRTPGLKAVLNHIAKPDIAAKAWQPWASQIARFGAFANIFCKISGMVTEAGPTWTPADLHPYVAHVCKVFGPDRVMFGSDWPVALLAADSYGTVIHALRSVIGAGSDAATQRKLFHDNGARFYGLAEYAPDQP